MKIDITLHCDAEFNPAEDATFVRLETVQIPTGITLATATYILLLASEIVTENELEEATEADKLKRSYGLAKKFNAFTKYLRLEGEISNTKPINT